MADSNTRKLIQLARQGDYNDFRDAYQNMYGADRAALEANSRMGEYAEMDPDSNYSAAYGDSDSKRRSKLRGRTSMGDAPDTFLGWVKESMATQYRENEGMDPHEFQDMGSIVDILGDNEGKIKGIGGILGDIGKNLGMQILLNFKQQNDLLIKMNENTGILGTLSRAFREEITEAYPEAIKLGISFSELTDSVTQLVTDSGKFKLLGQTTIEEMALASKFADSMTQYAGMAGAFEEISLGVHDMTEATTKAGMESLELGLNSRKVVKGLSEELALLNQYGFENGVEGLTKMVQKSIEFRLNMSDVTAMADKVWDPEGALEMVSNLQVLGGAVGDLNDPIKLMYMATNDIEGLQDAIIGASKSLVTYNNEQGRFEVTGSNLRRAKEMAQEFGMSMEDLTKTAVASMERTQAATDLMAQGLVFDNDEDKEFLTNLAQMRDGRMVIEVPQSLQDNLGATEIALGDMSQSQTDILLSQRDAFKQMDMRDIALDQVSLIENINRDVSFITASMRIQTGMIANDLARSKGFDPAKIAGEADALARQFGAKIDTDVVYDMINKKWENANLEHKLTPTNELNTRSSVAMDNTNPNASTAKETNSTSTTNVNYTHTYKSDANSDASRRAAEMANSRITQSDDGGYLNNFAIKY